MKDFTTNSDIHTCNTSNNDNLHSPLARLTEYQKAANYSSIKAYNCLPMEIKQLWGEPQKFKKALKDSYWLDPFIPSKNYKTGNTSMAQYAMH
jgi:hypothetical protein